jgi:magnesium chelatase subunit D
MKLCQRKRLFGLIFVLDYETEVVTCPFVQVPVNVLEDRLFGSVDVQKSLETGESNFVPGNL